MKIINFQLVKQLLAIRESVENSEDKNETLHKINEAIEILVTSEPQANQVPLVATKEELENNELKELFKKYEELQEHFVESNIGCVFSPETLRLDYGGVCELMQFQTHYKVSNGAMIDDRGIHPQQHIHLTDEGVKCLLAHSPKAREDLLSELSEWKEYELETKGVQNEKK